ncbi:MAG TPA: MBG domain-containing protein, partial [Vicinamibacterales bacterium]|nr:MBG domain-containing protein [Vicinamibacterales bacterium]
MKTSSSVNRSRTRITSLVALLILAGLASSWVVVRADVPRVASGTWAAAGEVAVPNGAVSTALADGRVVVAGGTSDDSFSSSIATYDPASGAWAHAGDLATARSGHAMTVLNDGRVLIAGGTASYGPTFDIEIYDPASGTSVHGGDMTVARVDAAAATLKDGRVLIVGGSDGVAPMNIAEIFDPATGQSVGVASGMSTVRVKATATALLDGHVLVAGGNDATGDLSSAEIFDPATGSFFNTGAMQTARSGHVAVLLPNNNQVLIAGGVSAGAPVASAELYADWRDGFSATPNAMSAARAGGIAAGLRPYDVAFVAGGGANAAEYFGYATLKTDKDDYAPYETVTISGSGWQPGEKVRLRVSEDADTHYDWELEAIADESGNIVNREFQPRNDEVYHHIGMRFYLTAVGIGSQALTTFTDAMQTRTSLTSSLNPAPAGQSVTFTATVEMNDKQGNQDNWKPAVGGSVFFYDRTTATDACDKNNGNYGVLLGSSAVNAGQATVSRAFVSGGTYPIQACYRGTGGNQGTQDSFSSVIQQSIDSATANTTTTASDLSATFSASNQNVTLSATVTSTSTVNAGSVTFTVKNGAVTIGSPVSAQVNSGSASQTFVLPANTPVGTYSIQAAYSGATGFNSSSDNTRTLTVGQGNQAVVTVSAPASATYQQTGLSAVASGGSGTGAYSYSHGTSTACTVNSTTGALTITSGTGTCDITASRAADANYDASAASAPASVTINKAPASIKANAKGKTYGDDNPALDAEVTGALNGDTLDYSLATTAVKFSAVGSYPITVTLGSNPNSAVSKVDAALTVNPALASVKANARSKTYGDDNPTLDAEVTGALNGDTLAYSLATTAVKFSAVGSYPIEVTLGTNPNYAVSKVDAALTVNPALATVKANAKSKTYGDDNPLLDAEVTGALNGDALSYSLATTAVKFSAVGSYPIEVTLGTNPNYTVNKVEAALTVNPALATVKANAKSKTYGDDNPTLDAEVTGALNGDTLDYT